VVFRNVNGLEEGIPCRAVIVAAGAINTAQILLQSSSPEFPDGLGNQHGVLGRYLHDHPLGKLAIDLDEPVGVAPPAYVSRAGLDQSQPLYAAALAQWGGLGLAVKTFLSRRAGKAPWVGFNVFGTLRPTPDNFVALNEARSTTQGAPALKLHIEHTPESVSLLENTRDETLELLYRSGLKPRLKYWDIEPLGTANHYAGTCRMHESAEFGMLNGFGRMHAVPNVVVADSSAFPTGPEKNPVLTAMALATRATARLAADLRAGAI
jgi:choline dehydrogenase-like flavoprotein